MRRIVKQIDNCVVIDQQALWEEIKTVPSETKLTALMKHAGVMFFDEECRFIAQPVVALAGIGGIPIHLNDVQNNNEIGLSIAPDYPFALKDLKKVTQTTMGMSAFYSYLNPKNITAGDMCQVSFNHGHTSIAHTTVVNLLVLGHSCGVENEFNSQRDLIHISRLTVARTQAQKNPPLVVLEPDHLPYYRRVLDQTQDILANSPPSLSQREHLESRNLLFPAAKGSVMMITASVRNLQKLMSGIEDQGKEQEYKRILIQMNQILSSIWEELFASTLNLKAT